MQSAQYKRPPSTPESSVPFARSTALRSASETLCVSKCINPRITVVTRSPLVGLLLLASLFTAPSAHACSACGCTLNSDSASQGLAASGGWRMDVRYDFFEQDQLRSCIDTVSRSNFTYPADTEVQRFTINRNYSAVLDYSPN